MPAVGVRAVDFPQTLLVRCDKDIWFIKTLATYPQRFCSRTDGRRKPKGNWLSVFHLENVSVPNCIIPIIFMLDVLPATMLLILSWIYTGILVLCLQCFDDVGWVAERASSL